MKKVVAFVAIIGLLLVGCGKPKVAKYCPQPGHGYACDASKHVAPMKDGKLHGVSKAYSYKGTLFESITYVEGKKEGLSTTYVSDNTYPGGANAGKPFRVTPYVNNKKHGMEKRYWSDTGTIAELTPYANGKKNGTYKKYFRDGKPAAIEHWKNGSLYGTASYWGSHNGVHYTKDYGNGQHKDDKISRFKRRAHSYCQDLSESLFTTEDKGRFISNCHGTKSYQRIYGK